MKIQFIYTFENQPQIITPYTVIFEPLISSKSVLISYAMLKLNKTDQQVLIKISCCVSDAKNMNEPEWYGNCNGKIWVDDLEIWREQNSVKSNISFEYLSQFAANN